MNFSYSLSSEEMHGVLNAARLLLHSQFIRKDPFFGDTETILKETHLYISRDKALGLHCHG